MPASTRLQVRSAVLTSAFAIYGVLTLTSMAAMSIGAGVLFIALLILEAHPKTLIKHFSQETHRRSSALYLSLSTALCLSILLSLLTAVLWPLGYGGRWVQVHFLKELPKLWYFLWPFVLAIGLRRLNAGQTQTVLRSWLGAFLTLSFLGIIQYFIGWPRVQPIPGTSHFHVTLFLGHHLSVASIFIFPFFAWLDYSYRILLNPAETSLKKLSVTFGTLVGCVALFLTYSRTLWVALPIGITLWIILTVRKKWVPLAIGVCILLGSYLVTQSQLIQQRMLDKIGINERKNLWEANLEFFKERPITGVGWRHTQELSGYYLEDKLHSNHVFAGHAHNNFLEILGGMGLVGAVCWIAWCLGIFYLISKSSRLNETKLNFQNNSDRITPLIFSKEALICAWIVFHLNGLTQVNFWEGKVQHQLAWVIAWTLL